MFSITVRNEPQRLQAHSSGYRNGLPALAGIVVSGSARNTVLMIIWSTSTAITCRDIAHPTGAPRPAVHLLIAQAQQVTRVTTGMELHHASTIGRQLT